MALRSLVHTENIAREIIFAGDEVRLAGQIDYPLTPPPAMGYPLVFVLHHAGWDTRERYAPLVRAALEQGYAVFRWDKRGSGRSGACGRGSATEDAALAYETALTQPQINRREVVIAAVGSGTALLGSAFGLFARTQRPHGVLLMANMLNDRAILAIDSRLKIVLSRQDWNPWLLYAEAAATAHLKAYRYGASYYVAPDAERLLMESGELHDGTRKVIGDWLHVLTLGSP